MLRRRRPLAALCAAVAVAAALSAAGERPPPTVAVVVAAHDLPAGTVLTADDLAVVDFAPGPHPTASRTDADGPGARRAGEPRRAGHRGPRWSGPAITAGDPACWPLPVRLPDAGMVALLRVGDRLDLVAADPQAGTAATVAASATVLALPAADEAAGPTGAPRSARGAGARPRRVPDVTAAACGRS